MIVAVDFDGTCVSHDYPRVGRDIGAVPVLKRLVDSGHQIIIWTMRSGKELTDAENWYKTHGIPVYGVNGNPTQAAWTASPKAYAQMYIDDAALGCPIMYNPHISDRPYVDWFSVESQLEEMEILRPRFLDKK
jgi:hypothetical protein